MVRGNKRMHKSAVYLGKLFMGGGDTREINLVKLRVRATTSDKVVVGRMVDGDRQ